MVSGIREVRGLELFVFELFLRDVGGKVLQKLGKKLHSDTRRRVRINAPEDPRRHAGARHHPFDSAAF